MHFFTVSVKLEGEQKIDYWTITGKRRLKQATAFIESL